MTDLRQALVCTPNPEFAPGCFGMGGIHRADLKECKTCPFFAQCGPIATADLELIRERLSVKTVIAESVALRRAVGATPASPLEALSTDVPLKVRQLIDRVSKMGLDVAGALRSGINPFSERPVFLRIASHMLIKMPSGVRRDQLRFAFATKLGWAEGTASAHAVQADQFMTALDVATEEHGILKLRRAA